MNWLDFVILAVLLWFTLTAYLSGLIRETVGLLAVVLGVVLAGAFHDNLSRSLDFLTRDTTALDVAAFLIIFALVAVGGWVLARLLRTAATLLLLGWADHAAGAFFGLIKGVVVVQAITVIFVLQPALGMEDAIADSTIGAFFLDTTPVVRALLPSEFDQALRQFPS